MQSRSGRSCRLFPDFRSCLILGMPKGYRYFPVDFLAVTALADLDSNLSGSWRPRASGVLAQSLLLARLLVSSASPTFRNCAEVNKSVASHRQLEPELAALACLCLDFHPDPCCALADPRASALSVIICAATFRGHRTLCCSSDVNKSHILHWRLTLTASLSLIPARHPWLP